MLRQDYFEAAVADEMLTGTYVEALGEFAQERASGRPAMLEHKERYRSAREFNDFFAVPVVLRPLATVFFVGASASGRQMVAGDMWTLARLLANRMQLVLPGPIRFVAFALRRPLVSYIPAGLARRLSPVSA